MITHDFTLCWVGLGAALLGGAICLQCGYDLRGQVEPRCPECGDAFDTRLLRVPGEGGRDAPGGFGKSGGAGSERS